MRRFTVVRRTNGSEMVLGFVRAGNITEAAIKAGKRFNNDRYDVFVVEG